MKCFVIQKNTVRHIIYEYLFVYASAASKRSVVLSPPAIFHFPIGIILMVIHMDIFCYISDVYTNVLYANVNKK